MVAVVDTVPATDYAVDLVSLVVVAYNEQDYLPMLLADIIAQDFAHEATEVVLIDSNAGQNHSQRQLLDEFALADHGFFRVVVVDNPDRDLPSGCNVALSVYRGSVFIRVDAHSRIPADFISRNVEVLQEGHDVCGGPRPVALDDPTAWRETLLAAETSGFGASAAAYRRITAPGEVDSIFHGAYRRRVLDQTGYYDRRLKRTEDNDYSARVRAAGFTIFSDPRITSTQYLRPSLRGLLRQKAANGYWIGRTMWIRPGAVSMLHLVPLVFVAAVVVALLIGLLVPWLPLFRYGHLSCWFALLGLSVLYLLAALLASVQAALRAPQIRAQMLLLPLIFLSMHISYGALTIAGLFSGFLLATVGLFRPSSKLES
jgi:glycosyltransferase involved in cell wall biosynthesis